MVAVKVGIVGSGGVGSTLGARLSASKHTVKYGSRDPASTKIADILSKQPGSSADTVNKTIEWAEVVVLATPGEHDMSEANPSSRKQAHIYKIAIWCSGAHSDDKLRDLASFLGEGIKGKVLIDATNPVSPYPGLEVRWSGKSGGKQACIR